MTTSPHAALASPQRQRLLWAIRSSAATTAAMLATGAGLPLSTVRFHLGELLAAGLIDAVPAPTTGRGRPVLRYSARTPEVADAGYPMLAGILADALADPSPAPVAAKAADAGRRWAHRSLPATPSALSGEQITASVAGFFTELGFEPEPGPGQAGPDQAGSGKDPARRAATSLRLHACPFAGLARRDPGAVCSAHLGILRGYLDQLGAAGAEATLVPWDTPTTCLAGIALAPAAVAAH
ncbi:helix-turn-helix transcriptional regulator [Pseudarthrobacter sp. P1]|uniref:helix-turn-helix transcriptional regulator n=1 Tax=Pseudarthrobacter sp. P1 TaxID=3418418 RepID=UPI003CF69F67